LLSGDLHIHHFWSRAPFLGFYTNKSDNILA
jgi:hypothetical protein